MGHMELETYRGAKDPHSAVVRNFMPGDGKDLTVSAPTERLWGGMHIIVVEGPEGLLDGLQFYYNMFRSNDPCWSSVRRHQESGGLCMSYEVGSFQSRISPATLLPLVWLAKLKRFSALLIYSEAELIVNGDLNQAMKVPIIDETSTGILVVGDPFVSGNLLS